jgi:uncharacterized protein YjiS (DUF1127 family)
MTVSSAVVNLVLYGVASVFGGLFRLIDHVESWADRRASRRALYGMSDIALADIGLTAADLSRTDPTCSWRSLFSRQP